MTQEELRTLNDRTQSEFIKKQEQKIQCLNKQIDKLKDENEMLAAITKYLMRYRLNDNETSISFSDIEKMVEIKSNVKVFENIGGEYFLKITLPKQV